MVGGQSKEIKTKMTIKLFSSQKHAFWQALILTIFVFGAGIFLGFVLENSRTSELKDLYFQADLDLLDIKIQNEIYSLSKIDCERAIQENINFADRVFKEGQLFEKYQNAARLSDSLVLQHKKYDLLRSIFWVNAIKLKSRCKADYHNVVYIYEYNEPTIETKAKQQVFSNLLTEIKQEKGGEVMLIPIAGDNDLISVNLLMDLYNISIEELPIILINEKIKITEIESKEDILKLID